MTYVKLNGLIAEILARGSEIDVAEFLADQLQLPLFKAEVLAERIKHQFITNPSSKPLRYVVEKNASTNESSQSCVYGVDCLSQREFEHFIKWLLEELGYSVEAETFLTTLGMDLVVQEHGERVAVLARRYRRNLKVTDAMVLAAQNALGIYECRRALVIATASFTQQAIHEAQERGVELWDMTTLAERINQARQKVDEKPATAFPAFHGSFLLSLFSLGKAKTFLIEPRAGEKYDLFLPGVKYPLLTFQVSGDKVVGCVYRIKYNEPVGESEGEVLIGSDDRDVPDSKAYELVVAYLEQFLE